MRQGEDRITVDYLDKKGERVLFAEAHQMDFQGKEGELLAGILYALYPRSTDYTRPGVYPRFRFSLQGVNSGFSALDQNLTYTQIMLLKDALDLFQRPELQPMRGSIFDGEISYLVVERLGTENIGVNFVGTKVVLLDRQYLFGNKYLLASVIAHEGSHSLQGAST